MVQWVYLDTKGVQQGPFTEDVMIDWYSKGYFPVDLQTKPEHATIFKTITDYTLFRNVQVKKPPPKPTPSQSTSSIPQTRTRRRKSRFQDAQPQNIQEPIGKYRTPYKPSSLSRSALYGPQQTNKQKITVTSSIGGISREEFNKIKLDLSWFYKGPSGESSLSLFPPFLAYAR